MGLSGKSQVQREAGPAGWKVRCWDFLPRMGGKAQKRRSWKCPSEARLEPSCPSLAVNPVFDPAEDSKDASASRSRPSVSGTRQSPPHSHPVWQLAGATRELG